MVTTPRFAVRLLLAVFLAPAASSVAAAVVTPGLSVARDEILSQPVFTISHRRPDGGGSSLWVSLGPPAGQVQITPVDQTVAWPTSWYQAPYDLLFDGLAVENMTPFANNWGDPETAITVDSLLPFYFASWAGNDYGESQPIIGPDDFYVWGRFSVNTIGGESTLVLLDSAITKGGIYVGTTVAVPEPSSLACMVGAAGLLGCWRRVTLCRWHRLP
jgi:hypothetical protein